jgi:hypothetical protein
LVAHDNGFSGSLLDDELLRRLDWGRVFVTEQFQLILNIYSLPRVFIKNRSNTAELGDKLIVSPSQLRDT